MNAKARINNSPHLYPLIKLCELCPEDEKNKPTEHHHPDYDEPTIYVSVCGSCHKFTHLP